MQEADRMQLPIQITFRDIEHSDFIEAKVRDRAARLDRFFDHIMSCRVTIEAPHKHKHKGNIYQVKIDITVPGNEIVVSKGSENNHAHEDAYVVIRDAFDAATRRLEDYVRRLRGDKKTHEVRPHGSIVELFPEMDYGIIKTSDDREIYFHRNSIIDENFNDLEIGNEVHFHEMPGDDGPKASTVYIEGKHHTVG
jgi:ribosomal subunit interface protein